MGRIAEALKRAEAERHLVRGSSPPPAGGLLSAPTLIDETEAVEQAPESEGITLVQGLSEALVPYYGRTSLVTEQYRSLRTRLLSQNPDYEHRCIAITSAIPKEGKSVTTLNLGCILAEIRHLKVLVVDGDFRRGSLAQMLNQPDGPGLAEALSGQAEYQDLIRKTPIPNLAFIPAGNTQGRSAAELLASVQARPLFRRMLNEFHYTIVDTPPATTVTDVGIIGQMCSCVIVVVRLNQTDGVDAKRCVRLLQANNVPIMGVLLIGRDAPGDRYGYGYGYSYGYQYSRYYDYYTKSTEGG